MLRTNTRCKNKIVSCGYGKQILNGARSASRAMRNLLRLAGLHANKADVGFGEAFIDDSQQCAGVNGLRRQRAEFERRAQSGGGASRPGFRQTFVDRTAQGRWPEWLAQAPRRPKAERDLEAGGIIRFGTEKT